MKKKISLIPEIEYFVCDLKITSARPLTELLLLLSTLTVRCSISLNQEHCWKEMIINGIC